MRTLLFIGLKVAELGVVVFVPYLVGYGMAKLAKEEWCKIAKWGAGVVGMAIVGGVSCILYAGLTEGISALAKANWNLVNRIQPKAVETADKVYSIEEAVDYEIVPESMVALHFSGDEVVYEITAEDLRTLSEEETLKLSAGIQLFTSGAFTSGTIWSEDMANAIVETFVPARFKKEKEITNDLNRIQTGVQ